MDSSFFDETTEQSVVKSTIVSKYFWAWAQVILPQVIKRNGVIAYIDLFAGPGRYKDGTNSTPLMVLQQAIQKPEMCKRFVTIFNDKDENNANALQEAINALEGIAKLQYAPQVNRHEVGTEIIKLFQQRSGIPTFFFIDPWGYKGLSLGLIQSAIKDWGCDCVFFFNYNRINMGITNPFVQEHMDALFGPERAAVLRTRIQDMSVEMRELTIIEELCQALKALGGKFVLPFRFKNADGSRTSHHLIFVSKDFKGYEIMKDIMAKECTACSQGVPSLEYNPATQLQPFLFELARPLDDLSTMLLTEFAGKRIQMKDIYQRHCIDKQFIKRNYKEVLKHMELNGAISAIPPASERKANTFADDVTVCFPIQETPHVN